MKKNIWLLALTLLLAAFVAKSYTTITSNVAYFYHAPTPYSEYPGVWLPSSYQVLDKKTWNTLPAAPSLDVELFKELSANERGLKFFLHLNDADKPYSGGSIKYYAVTTNGHAIQSFSRTYDSARPDSYHVKGHALIQGDGRVRVDWIAQPISEKSKFRQALQASVILTCIFGALAASIYFYILNPWNPYAKKRQATTT